VVAIACAAIATVLVHCLQVRATTAQMWQRTRMS
jgi:hypothetical protein